MTPRFDPTKAILFDLARGQMRDDEGNARLNLPAALLVRLCEQAGPAAAQDFAQSLGSDVGRRIESRLGQHIKTASLEEWTDHLGGQLALLGLGDLSVERWGQALTFVVSSAPAGCTTFIGQLLGAALQRALARQVELVAFAEQSITKYLLVAPDTAAKVSALVQSGQGIGQVVEQLKQGAA
ncbi:MAG TPA: hypothetical protein VN764_01415 [Polyangiaceae bacterium]|nr:hypothetical protein [Polyangiaceae bacterium]